MGTRKLRHLDYLFPCRLGLCIGYILIYIPGKQEGFLKHHAHLRAQGFLRNILDVYAIDANASRLNVVHSHDKVYKRRFSNSGFADKSDEFATLYVNINIGQDLGAAFVSK